MTKVHKSAFQLQNIVSLRVLDKKSQHSTGSKQFKVITGQSTSPVLISEKCVKIKPRKQNEKISAVHEDPHKANRPEHRIDIDELSDLLGYDVYSGKLTVVKSSKSTGSDEPSGSGNASSVSTNAKLTSKAMIWGSQTLLLEDVASVSYNTGLRYFSVHAYPLSKRTGGLSYFCKPKRSRKDFRFLASSSEEAILWVSGFADLQCFVKCSPHPMNSSRTKSAEDLVSINPLSDQPYIKCKRPSKILVILNPRSGHGRSSTVYYGKVQPIFELAGFQMEVVKTTAAGHARKLAATVDINICSDGIVCVGGDGVINEVLNGLLNREDKKETISVPIGIIPAGSDNSLIWTVLGIRDPITAALSIVKGGFTPTDVFAVKWIQTGAVHYGNTVSYFGFLSDVLELSDKYQKRFGPLRYFVAGFLKFLCLPNYSFDLEYLPATKETHLKQKKPMDEEGHNPNMSDLYKDILRRSRREGIPRASSLSSIESIMSPSRISGDFETTGSSTLAGSEPSDLVRGLRKGVLGFDNQAPKSKIIHPKLRPSSSPNLTRTRSKPWADQNFRLSWAPTTSLNDREEISSAVSNPGPVWDVEPKWDGEANRGSEAGWEDGALEYGAVLGKEPVPELSEKWEVKKGKFLGILACNHSCRTVQSLSSQVVAPKAVHDDNCLDLLLVRGSGRLRLLRFFISLQFGRHLSLPFVEYVKARLEVMGRKAKNASYICGNEAGKLSREIAKVEKRRIIKNTLLNERSSRSHCVIILDVPSVGGRLMLVDMAGSENIEQAGQAGFEAKIQTAKINQGNIALKRVVESIANGDSHVPFRDSKLTMLLQDSFEDENSKILMILCASPDPKEMHKTIATLEYGAKAKCIVRVAHMPTPRDKLCGEDSSPLLRSRIVAMNQFIYKLQMENKVKDKECDKARRDLLCKEEEILQLRSKIHLIEGRPAAAVKEEEIRCVVDERTRALRIELRKMEEKVHQQQEELYSLRKRLEERESIKCAADDDNEALYLHDGNGGKFLKRLAEICPEDQGMEKSMDLDLGDQEEPETRIHDVREIKKEMQHNSLNSCVQENNICFGMPKFPEKLCLSTVFERDDEGEDRDGMEEEVDKEIVECIEHKFASLSKHQTEDFDMLLGLEDGKDSDSTRRTRIQNIFRLCGNHRELAQHVAVPTPIKRKLEDASFHSLPLSQNKELFVSSSLIPPLPKIPVVDGSQQELKENKEPAGVEPANMMNVYVKWEASKEFSGNMIRKMLVMKSSTLSDLRKLIEIHLEEINNKQPFTFLMLADPLGAPVPVEKEDAILVSKLPACNGQQNTHLACLRPARRSTAQWQNHTPFSSLENTLLPLQEMKTSP